MKTSNVYSAAVLASLGVAWRCAKALAQALVRSEYQQASRNDELPGIAEHNNPQSDSDDDGFAVSRSEPLTIALHDPGEPTDTAGSASAEVDGGGNHGAISLVR
ncbi:hypothetical protein CRV24_000420 [Beauveria bassiana]|nr:hypothetical protein CRV24_000420 [Beauveria bassiana]